MLHGFLSSFCWDFLLLFGDVCFGFFKEVNQQYRQRYILCYIVRDFANRNLWGNSEQGKFRAVQVNLFCSFLSIQHCFIQRNIIAFVPFTVYVPVQFSMSAGLENLQLPCIPKKPFISKSCSDHKPVMDLELLFLQPIDFSVYYSNGFVGSFSESQSLQRCIQENEVSENPLHAFTSER